MCLWNAPEVHIHTNNYANKQNGLVESTQKMNELGYVVKRQKWKVLLQRFY